MEQKRNIFSGPRLSLIIGIVSSLGTIASVEFMPEYTHEAMAVTVIAWLNAFRIHSNQLPSAEYSGSKK